MYKLIDLAIPIIKSNFSELKLPYKLNFAITYRCQSRCLTCNIWQMHPNNELTLDEIKLFASKNRFFKWVELTGGEPFLRSDIYDIAKAINDTNNIYMLTIPTNSLTNKELIIRNLEKILNLGIPRVVITLSLDGYKELHDQIRGIKGNFDRVMDLAKALQELKNKHRNLSFYFGYTISRYNQGKLKETIEYVKNILPFVDFNYFHVNVGQISEHYYNNKNSNFIGEKEAIKNDIRYLLKNRRFSLSPIELVENAFIRNLITYVDTGKSPMKNRSLEASIFLDSFGNVFPSIVWDYKLGNIRETSYDLIPIINSNDAKNIRKLIKEGKEPPSWTACEAYQTLVGDMHKILI